MVLRRSDAVSRPACRCFSCNARPSAPPHPVAAVVACEMRLRGGETRCSLDSRILCLRIEADIPGEGHMKTYGSLTLNAALLTAALGVFALAGSGVTQAAPPVATCYVRLRVELTPDVPNPRGAGFLSSLLGNHPEYLLTLRGRDSGNGDVVALDLIGPGPVVYCREVIESIRKDARVISVVEVSAQ